METCVPPESRGDSHLDHLVLSPISTVDASRPRETGDRRLYLVPGIVVSLVHSWLVKALLTNTLCFAQGVATVAGYGALLSLPLR